MSGLAAVFTRDGRFANEADVQSMLAAIPYRGLDGTGLRSFGPVVLGLARTWITPEEPHEQQPLVSPRTGAPLSRTPGWTTATTYWRPLPIDRRDRLPMVIGSSARTKSRMSKVFPASRRRCVHPVNTALLRVG